MEANGRWRSFSTPETPKSMVVGLSTGYKVSVTVNSFDKDLRHLLRALLGEHFLTPARQKADWNAAFKSLQDGVAHVVCQRNESELRLLAGCILWYLCGEEWERIRGHVNRAKRKREK